MTYGPKKVAVLCPDLDHFYRYLERLAEEFQFDGRLNRAKGEYLKDGELHKLFLTCDAQFHLRIAGHKFSRVATFGEIPPTLHARALQRTPEFHAVSFADVMKFLTCGTRAKK